MKAFVLLLFAFTWQVRPALTDEQVLRGYPIHDGQLIEYWTRLAEAGHPLDYPRLAYSQNEGLRQGQVGVFVEDMGSAAKGNTISAMPRVLQVIDSQKCLVNIRHSYLQTIVSGAVPTQDVKQFDTLTLVDGVETAGLADGVSPRWQDKFFIVDGNYSYTTTSGAVKTIPVLKLTQLPKLPSHAAELGVGVVQWTDITGGFSVHAAYDKYEKGNVHLVKQDGTTIEVPLARLSVDSQKIVREKIRIEAEKRKEQQKNERQNRSKG
jgi:hypothetical protein